MAATHTIPKTLVNPSRYCPGCGHGIVNRVLAEVLEEMKLDDKTVGVLAVGCSCLMPFSFAIDWIQAPHGRAPACATGLKRMRPDVCVFTYQGDGDLAAIGTAEIIHAAARNENFSVIFVNNGVFGMTGGQMAPTTLIGQKTTTSPSGRDPRTSGIPLRVAEMLSNFPVAYIARGTIINPAEIRKTKEYIRNAFKAQLENRGFSLVEILTPCPTNWHLPPARALERLASDVISYYPTGEFVK